MNKRRSILTGLLGFAGLSAVKSSVAAPQENKVLFSYRTLVINFSPTTGIGDDIGSVDGVIQGALLQNFQFIPTSPTSVITPDDRALFTDVDGNQILFRYAGTGTFFQGLSDSASPLGNLQAIGGHFVATYTVLQASTKYAFLIGRQFPAKIIATNSANPSNGVFGTVYAEIYASQPDIEHIGHLLNN
jgi:hypothetical protein